MQRNMPGQFITMLVIDTLENVPRKNDQANLTLFISKDNGLPVPLASQAAVQIDANAAPGMYRWPLTQAETDAARWLFSGVSTTTGAVVIPREIFAAVNPAFSLTLGATIPVPVGSVIGLTEELVVGDSYTQAVGRRIPITLTDADGNAVPVTFGTRSLSDVTCTIMCLLHPENSRNVESVTAAAQGPCAFTPQSGQTPASLLVSLPATETSKLSPGVYRVQIRATWNDGETVTLAWKGSAKFVRRIKAKT